MHFLDEVMFVGALAETLMFVRDRSFTVLEDVEGSFEVDVVVKTVENTIDERVFSSHDREMFFGMIYDLSIETLVSNGWSTVLVSIDEQSEEVIYLWVQKEMMDYILQVIKVFHGYPQK